MDTYYVYLENGTKINSVSASSYEDAFEHVIGDYVHREVSKDEPYDVYIDGVIGIKYYWIRFG